MTVALGKVPVRTDGGYWSLLQCVRDDPPPALPAHDPHWHKDFRDFVVRCLQKDPRERWTCEALLAHPFLALADSGGAGGDHGGGNTAGGCGSGASGGGKGGNENDPAAANALSLSVGGESSSAASAAAPSPNHHQRSSPRSSQQQQQQQSVRAALRGRAEDDLAALLAATHGHLEGILSAGRGSALAALHPSLATAPDATSAMAVLFGRCHRPQGEGGGGGGSGGEEEKWQGGEEKSGDEGGEKGDSETLQRLAEQLNLPIEALLERVDAACSKKRIIET